MNYKLVFYNIGSLLILLSVAMAICLGIGYVLPPGAGHSGEKALTGWEISIAITVISGVLLFFLGNKEKKSRMLRRDALGIVGLGWLMCSFYASLPYVFCEPHLTISNAYFEAVSGLTTTGASVLQDFENLPETIFLWRSECQWLGGMGILAMFILVLSNIGASGKNVFFGESSAHLREIIDNRLHKTVKSLWKLYIFLTLICFLGLWLLGMTAFQAVNHAMATVSTGGFGTEADSINGFGTGIRLWILLFMLICGLSLPLLLIFIKRERNFDILRKHEETWFFIGILFVAGFILFFDRLLVSELDESVPLELVNTFFMTVSIATTTGFVIGDYDSWPTLTKGIILFLMIGGGCAGSTAGGLKISRLILWIKVMRAEIRKGFRPNQMMRINLNGWPVPEGTRGQLFIIITSAAATIAVSSYILVGLEPDKTADGCISAVITCITNVGPGFKEFGPTQNFASLTDFSKVLLALLMIVGRLEYIAIFALFSKTLWKRY